MASLQNKVIATKPTPVDAVLWRTYDEGGWQQLERHHVTEAFHYFQKAMEKAEEFAENDYRRGRTLAGLAWSEYRIAERIDEAGDTPADPDELFRQPHSDAQQAVRILSASDLSQQERQFLARAHHVLGLTQIELCDGAAAEASLATAGSIYRELLMTERYFDALHLVAKLRQCRREFTGAASLFRQIFVEAQSPERCFGALVDLANTLVWMGYIREAWQLRVTWRRLDSQLERLPDHQRPLDELFRGRLVFARVNLLYGDFDEAERLLETAHARLCACPTISTICRAVYWIVSAELALQRGDLPRVTTCLAEFHQIAQDIKLSKKGYGCLEIVAIDAACQICVVETCTYEVIRQRCCFRRRCCRVVFVPVHVTSTHTEQKPVDFNQILAAIVNGIRAGVEYHKGHLAASQTLLGNSVSAIEEHLNKQSPLLITLRLLQAEVAQSRKESPDQIRQLLQTASDIVSAVGASQHPFAAERNRLLANWRVALSEYDLAAELYQQSLRHGANCRSELHVLQVLVQIALAAAQGAAATGGRNASSTLNQLQDTIWPQLANLQRSLSCHDYRIGLALATPVWICLLAGCVSAAQRSFMRGTQYWVDRDDALNLVPPDDRRAETLLGTILTSIQQGALPSELEPLFVEYRDLATGEITNAMAAFELNRIGMLMFRAFLLPAAKYCFDKSIELYPSQNFGRYRPNARDNLQELAIVIARNRPTLRARQHQLPEPEEVPAVRGPTDDPSAPTQPLELPEPELP